MSTTSDKTEKISEQLAANNSKSALVEKIVFAGIPILFSCVVYLMTQLSGLSHDNTVLQSKIAVVVNQDNKAIPAQGQTIEMATIREALNEKIDKVEKDAALARANMTLDREKQLAALEKQRMEMMAEAAQARAAIRSDLAALSTKLTSDVSDHVDSNEKNAALARADLDKRIALIELNIQMIKTMITSKTK
jgi:hypothetical protein